MNFTALDIIHFWVDSRGKQIQRIFPTNGRVCVHCTHDLSNEATKVCNFIHLIIQQTWSFQMEKEKDTFVIFFFPETVTLSHLFQTETDQTTRRKSSKRKNM